MGPASGEFNVREMLRHAGVRCIGGTEMSENQDGKGIIKAGLRSIAASIPVAASLAQAWNEYEAHIQSARIEEFFSILKAEIEGIKERIEKEQEFIRQSGEIPSLIERTIDKLRKENSRKKRERFAHLLANSIAAGPRLGYDDKLTFVETLDTLTDQDISVLSVFEPDQKPDVRAIENSDALAHFPSEERLGKLVVSLAKLQSRGLISETIIDSGHGEWTSGATGWVETWREKHFELLPQGVMFCKLMLGDGI